MIARRRGERVDEWSVALERGFDPYNSADLPHVIAARNARRGCTVDVSFIFSDICNAPPPTQEQLRKMFEAMQNSAHRNVGLAARMYGNVLPPI